MGKTLTEKILGRASGREVKAGDYVVVEVDKILLHDASGPLAVEQFRKLGKEGVAKPEATFISSLTMLPPVRQGSSPIATNYYGNSPPRRGYSSSRWVKVSVIN